VLGERASDPGRLEQAVQAFRQALKEYTKESSPYYFDVVHQNLVNALTLLKQMRPDAP
jgi:hypothetical protein